MLNSARSRITDYFSTKYLSDQCLNGFDNYKYSCIDTSPLSLYVMHPLWNFLVQYVPVWIAPNLLTFTGFLLTVLNFVIFTSLDYSFYASTTTDNDHQSKAIPQWIFLLAAVNFYVAYTLDGMDGKQARRTKTSGPLGELFDHGVDSFSSSLIPISMYSIIGRGVTLLSPTRMYFIIWTVLMNFYVPHFEKYTTGVLFLPWSFDVSMLLIVIVYVIASIMGPKISQILLFNMISLPVVCEILVYFSIVSSLPMTLYNIYKSYKDKSGKMHSILEFTRPLVSIAILFGLMVIWIVKSPSNIIDCDPRIFYLLTGVIFSNISCKLIIAQMSSMRCELINHFIIPLPFVILLSLLIRSVFIEMFFMYAYTLIALVAHLHYGICVVKQLCDHFNVKCFRIRQVIDKKDE